MNVLQKAVSMVEVTGPGILPHITMSFATADEMEAASDYLRLLAKPLSPEARERGFQSLLGEVLDDLRVAKETPQ